MPTTCVQIQSVDLLLFAPYDLLPKPLAGNSHAYLNNYADLMLLWQSDYSKTVFKSKLLLLVYVCGLVYPRQDA